jgi:hypothetical protein
MNVNRWIEGNPEVILVTADSGVTVELGDLMFLDSSDGLRNNGASTATNFTYPISYLRGSGSSLELNKALAKAYFLGIAMSDKDGISDGADSNVSVGTGGKYRLSLKPGHNVRANYMFGASGTTTGSDLYNQYVMYTTEVSKALGYFAEHKDSALTAEAVIRTAFGPDKKIS